MIQCPKCSASLTELGIRGPVLIAEGIVEVDADTNKLVAISPLKATQTIAVGTEVTSVDMLLICGKCRYAGPQNTYKITSSCVLTGKPTDISVETNCGVMFVAAGLEAEAQRVFSEANADWGASIVQSVGEI